MNLARAFACVLPILATLARAEPQGRWLPANAPGVADSIYCMTEWDPDGPGPLDPWLVVAGNFFQAGFLRTTNIAAWDGEEWNPLAEGVGVPGSTQSVSDLAVWNGELYAIGTFTHASGVPAKNVARFDGTQWHPLAEGLNQRGFALLPFGNELIVGGDFLQVGASIAAPYIARWNGTQWAPFSGATPLNGRVRDLTLYNNEIVACGLFGGGTQPNGVARWDGAAWRPFGSGMNAYVRALAVHGADLVAVGEFTQAGGLAANRVALWNGAAWTALGAGFPAFTAAGAASVNGDLYVAGWNGSTTFTPLIQRWSNGSWSGLQEGIASEGWIAALMERNGELIIGGRFWHADRGAAAGVDRWVTLGGLGKWTGQNWEQVSDGEWIDAMGFAEHDGRIAVVGSTSGEAALFGSTPTTDHHHAKVHFWDGVRLSTNVGVWAPHSQNFVLRYGASAIRAAESHEGRLYVAGTALRAGIGATQHHDDEVAWFDGSGWHFFPWFATAGGGPAKTLCSAGGSLYIGLHTVDGMQNWVDPWCKLDGDVFPPVGGLMLAVQTHSPSPSRYVQDSYRDGDQVIIAGRFSDTPSGIGRGGARWTGSEWEFFPVWDGGWHYGPNNTPQSPRAESITMHKGSVFLGGLRGHNTGTGIEVIGVDRLDGNHWTPIGRPDLPAGSPNGPVFVLESFRDRLIAGGWFIGMDGAPGTAHIAAWDGQSWQGLGGGASFSVHALRDHGEELLVGGYGWPLEIGWYHATVGDVYSPRFARWTDTGIPWVAYQPEPVNIAPAETAIFSMNPASGYDFDGPVHYQWRRNGVPINDGPAGASPGGGVVQGASGALRGRRAAKLTITNAQSSDAGDYSVLIWNNCGSRESNPAPLTVSLPPCPGDANGDRVVNFVDLNLVLSFFGQSVAPGTNGDLNNDGAVNFQDLNLVLSFFGTSC